VRNYELNIQPLLLHLTGHGRWASLGDGLMEPRTYACPDAPGTIVQVDLAPDEVVIDWYTDPQLRDEDDEDDQDSIVFTTFKVGVKPFEKFVLYEWWELTTQVEGETILLGVFDNLTVAEAALKRCSSGQLKHRNPKSGLS
jgi:hypothetical protein